MIDSFRCFDTLTVHGKTYHFANLKKAAEQGLEGIEKLPFSLKVLLANLLQFEDGATVTREDIQAFSQWLTNKQSTQEIAFHPARVLMQDFTGVPAVVDLAAMRTAMTNLKGDPTKINPLCPVDLVIDHSVQVDQWASMKAYSHNVATEMERNHERYQFLKWGQQTLDNFRVVPPGTGICHQVNLEYLGQTVWSSNRNGQRWAYPDTLVGTDSHTTMINGLGVLGWGVGGIEAEAAMLGQPISMVIPEVIGFKFTGQLREGITATDLVLTVTQMLRKKGVVSKFVEYFGEGLHALPVADRATLANMAPEYGATCGFFPVDQETLDYMTLTGRSAETIELVKTYTQAQGLWHEKGHEPIFTDVLELDLSTVEPSLAGPKRPQDRVNFKELTKATEKMIEENKGLLEKAFSVDAGMEMHHGDVVIAAITSCTNTSNPHVMMGAGLLAKKALEKGLMIKPWVKTSLAPGSKVVTDYLEKAGLLEPLNALGFNLVGYGCTTCIGNSGPLSDVVSKTITENNMTVCAVLSGNRNFEGRIHPLVRANWLASPPLVVAFALAGTTRINLNEDPLGINNQGEPIYLKDIWPTQQEIAQTIQDVSQSMFKKEYSEALFEGTEEWQRLKATASETYAWDAHSTYIQYPPFFEGMTVDVPKVNDIKNARILAVFGDSITTDHISPAGSIKADSPAGQYLQAQGVKPVDFNSYGARRGNHEVMIRGTFANIRIKNEMMEGKEGGLTRHQPDGKEMTIYDAAMAYQRENTPLVVIAGKEYGTGSSRDWAAKGTLLLGVKAVIAETFERIHRSNLVGMGVLPLHFENGDTHQSLGITGKEKISLEGLSQSITPNMRVMMKIEYENGSVKEVSLLSRITTQDEANYYENGGILQYVLRQLLARG
ncbi:MAG TPA: aconitate hydratase AcnA [Coxiellaceae bacterium]|nr:aconitate hydratase AcnA [Coxiellaceae bacterium]